MPYRDLAPDGDRSILVAAVNGIVHGMDRESGKERWTVRLRPMGERELMIVLRHGLLLVAGYRERVYRLDYLTGATLWVRNLAGGKPTILVESDRIVIAKGGTITCLDHDGNPLWERWVAGDENASDLAALGFPGNVAQII